MKKDISLYKDLLDVVQKYVDDSLKDYGDAKFQVSLLENLGHKDKRYDCIMLTITHMQSSFSEIIFPRQDMQYGYESIDSIMNSLYARTM